MIAGFITGTKKPQLRGFLFLPERVGQNPSASLTKVNELLNYDQQKILLKSLISNN
jgi:hypothetical protein